MAEAAALQVVRRQELAATERTSATWASFLRSQADVLLACGFFETVTLSGARLYVLAVIEHASRRIRILGATPHPTACWVVQAARNLVMDLEDAGSQARFLIRDRDGKFPGLFDAILADAGIETVLSGVQMPRMNAIMERWVQTCRRELLDRTLVIGKEHPPGRSTGFKHCSTPRPPNSKAPTTVRGIASPRRPFANLNLRSHQGDSSQYAAHCVSAGGQHP